MALNEIDARGERFQILATGATAANSGVGPNSGDPLILGLAHSPSASLAVVCLTNYTPPGSLPATGYVSVSAVGIYALSVAAKTSINPGNGVAINPGDLVYADGGMLDTTDGLLYGFTLNANSTTGWKFGRAMDAITSGQTATIRVRIGGN